MSSSAFVGEVPASQDDFDIIRGIYRTYSIPDSLADPSLGYIYAPPRPVNDTNESKQAAIIAGMVVVILAIVIPTTARIWIRLTGRQMKFGLDDWVIIAAAALGVIYPILVIAMCVQAGGGLHVYNTTYEQYNQFFYYLAVCKDIFYVAVGMIKISIALFVRRLADRASKGWRIFIDVYLVIATGFILASLFWNTFICNPPRASWDKLYMGGLAKPPVCGNMNLASLTLSIIHVTLGGVLLSAPIIILWKIQIDTAKKIRLFCIWLAGGTTVVGGLLQQTAVVITNDATWQFTSVIRWTCLDLALGLLTASLPVLDTAIMGGWRSAVTRIGGRSASNSRSATNDWGATNGAQSRRTVIERGPKEFSESNEDIISKDNKDVGFEMNIVRTDRVSMSYEDDVEASRREKKVRRAK